MTAHEFAYQLLAGPDLPIMVPKVAEYSDEDDNCCADPVLSQQQGTDPTSDEPGQVIVISYLSHQQTP